MANANSNPDASISMAYQPALSINDLLQSILASWLKKPWILSIIMAFFTIIVQIAYRFRYDFGPLDDAYIHLRIAENLASGNGPVFNVGDRVEVTSSPMWTVLLGGLLWIGVKGKTAAIALGLIAAGCTGAAVSLLGYLVGGLAAAMIAPALLAILPSFAAWAGSGMETPLGLCILTATFASVLATKADKRSLIRTGILSGLLMYVRPELVAVLPSIILIAWLLTPKSVRVGSVALLAAVSISLVAILFLTRFWYFHEWLPNTYYAKVADGGLTQRIRGLSYTWALVTQHGPYFAVAVYALWRGNAKTRLLGLVAFNVMAATIWAGGDGFRYSRLALPAIPIVCAIVAASFAKMNKLGVVVIATTALCILQLIWSTKLTNELGLYLSDSAFARNAVTVGEMMSDMPPGTVAVIPVGAIGYVTKRPILDLVGLADKHIARAKRIPGAAIGHDHSDVSYVLNRAPELVLLVPWTNDREYTDEIEHQKFYNPHAYSNWASAIELYEDERFKQEYTPRNYSRSGQHIRVWLRKDIAE